MPTRQELRTLALDLYKQGSQHYAEANEVVHDLVFGSVNEGSPGPMHEDLELLVAGLNYGAWDYKAWWYIDQVIAMIKAQLPRIRPPHGAEQREFIVVDHLSGQGQYEAALKVIHRIVAKMNDPTQALVLESDLDMADRHLMVLRRLAECQVRMDQKRNGLSVAWQAVMLDRSDPLNHRFYGKLLNECGDRTPAIMALAFAIGLEPDPANLPKMLTELIDCLDLESDTIDDRHIEFNASMTLLPESKGSIPDVDYMLYEMSIAAIKTTFKSSGADYVHRPLINSVIETICDYCSEVLEGPPKKIIKQTMPFRFYAPFFSSLKRAGVVKEFVDHLYRTTHVSESPAHDPDDRFRIRQVASGGDPLPEDPNWRAHLDDDEHDDAGANGNAIGKPSTSVDGEVVTYTSSAPTPVSREKRIPFERKVLNFGAVLFLLLSIAFLMYWLFST